MTNAAKVILAMVALSPFFIQTQAWAQTPRPESAGSSSSPSAGANQQAPVAFTKGTVVETMSGGGYTFVCIENAGQKRWAAMPPTAVKVGQEVELATGMEMANFTSKSLGRTFETIFFCGGVRPREATDPGAAGTTNVKAGLPHPLPASQGFPPGHGMRPGSGTTSAEEAAALAKASSSRIAGKVVESLDGGGYTFAAVEKDGQRNWVAIPPTKLVVGQEVVFVPGFDMTNFTSKSLNRTFDKITFSSGVVKQK